MTPRAPKKSPSYQHDLIRPNEKLKWIFSSKNINVAITPDPSGLSYAVNYNQDHVLNRIQAINPELGQVYKHLRKLRSGLQTYSAGFFWLRLPKPNSGMSSL